MKDFSGRLDGTGLVLYRILKFWKEHFKSLEILLIHVCTAWKQCCFVVLTSRVHPRYEELYEN